MRPVHVVGYGPITNQLTGERQTPTRPSLVANVILIALMAGILTGCAGGSQADVPSSPGASPGLVAAVQSIIPDRPPGASVSICEHVATVEERLAALEAVELRLPNRVALDIELGKLQAAFTELRQADMLGPFEEQLETALTRLGHRLEELELAVEDFRTNSRPQQAVDHVETDATTFGSELSAFAILARC
jgi:hypothetical protein